MNTVKKCFGDIKRTEAYTLICKMNYISSCDNQFVESINSGIAERTLGGFLSSKINFDGVFGDVFAVLTPALTCFNEKIVSIKYDLTVTSGSILIFHKRFAVNLLYDFGLFLLPGFLKGQKHKPKGEFYLKESEDGLLCTPILKNMPSGTPITRRREIDIYCDGKSFKVGLVLPEYIKIKNK